MRRPLAVSRVLMTAAAAIAAVLLTVRAYNGQGDYALACQRALSVVDAHSFRVGAYLEETAIPRLGEGDPALVELIGGGRMLHGHVVSVARGIRSEDAQAGGSGLASVNPVALGCGWRSAYRCASRSTTCQTAPG